jgi:hypothetical protein
MTRPRPGRFDARLLGFEQFLVESTRTSFCDAARILLAAGLAHAVDLLVTWHAGSEHVALKAAVGVAARLTVDEASTPRFARWRGRPHPRSRRGPVPWHRLRCGERFLDGAAGADAMRTVRESFVVIGGRMSAVDGRAGRARLTYCSGSADGQQD